MEVSDGGGGNKPVGMILGGQDAYEFKRRQLEVQLMQAAYANGQAEQVKKENVVTMAVEKCDNGYVLMSGGT